MLEHMVSYLPCRPGITGAATFVFAREEEVLAHVPKQHLKAYYHKVVLPAKRRLDAEYMARATYLSDLKLITSTLLRHWDTSVMYDLLDTMLFEAEDRKLFSMAKAPDPESAFTSGSVPFNIDQHASTEEVAAR
jgi:hypothetical protein